MKGSWYLLLFMCIALGKTASPAPFNAIESNFLYLTEQDTLATFWKQDMEYIAKFITTSEIPSYTYSGSAFTHVSLLDFRFASLKLRTDNMKMVFDPAHLQVRFSQLANMEYDMYVVWEYNYLILPVFGTARFRGHASDVVYMLNLTQPYQGRLFNPDLVCNWVIDSAEIEAPFSRLHIQEEVTRAFEQAMKERITGMIVAEIQDSLPIEYEERYNPKSDYIRFSGLEDKTVGVMRRYKNIRMNPHMLAVGYHENVEGHSFPEEIDVSGQGQDTVFEPEGILRRYLRDVAVFEQVSKKVLGLITDYKVMDKDLPTNQRIRLDATSIQMMIPDFKMRFGNDALITLVVNGDPSLSQPVLSAAGSQESILQNIVLNMTYYVSTKEGERMFLGTTVKHRMTLKPTSKWVEGELAVNFELLGLRSELLRAESPVFAKEIVYEGIKRYSEEGTQEFLMGKCRTNMMGDGLKIKDELESVPKSGSMVDLSGRTLNVWLFSQEQQQ